MKEIFILILLLIIVILITCIVNFKRRISELESFFEYYKWHDNVYDIPQRDGWFLVQTDDTNKRIDVLHYTLNKFEWNNLCDGKKVEAWMHLPHYTHPKNNL